MAKPKITLYVDTVSPFAYEAYYILRHDPIFSTCDITYIPVFLGGIMKSAGNTPPIDIKNKDTWIAAERTRWATRFNIPIIATTPADFPPLTLPVMRSLCALMLVFPGRAQEMLVRGLDAFFKAYWVDGRNTIDPVVLGEVLREVVEGDEAMLARVRECAAAEGKQVLLENTALAFKEGAFGLPWFVCENAKGEKEGLWGVDHLGCVVDFLGLEKPRAGGWKSVL
ncbi:2-hydroxychromene-2-carboxylate isomeras-like protein [Coleophoma cylindrospora]|uniref:Glutathione S-transferase kappa n=1 Tax=Coleophoma cylindrospora TaxID=1849047 RepID=A0A3D8RMD7_9HELO|nr:2-hydroxychromene-2-carboxylate isomeras-like protein [Coleophoma cylindrospora]